MLRYLVVLALLGAVGGTGSAFAAGSGCMKQNTANAQSSERPASERPSDGTRG